MKKVLLISINDIIRGSVIEDNVDSKLLSKTIQIAQETGLKSILGTTLYDGLIDAVYDYSISGTPLTTAYSTLLDAAKPYLIAKTVSDFILINNYKVSNKGIMKLNDNSATALSDGDLENIKSYYDNLISTHKSSLVKFLKDSNLIDYNNDVQISSESTGWFLGVPYTTPSVISNETESSIDSYVAPADGEYTYQQLDILRQVLLISTSDIISNSVIEDNVDVKLLSRTIKTVQETYLKQILTEDLYWNTVNAVYLKQVSGQTFSSFYADLLSMIKPYMINKVVAEYIIPNQYKFTAKGLMKLNDSSSTALNDSDVENVKNHYDNISTTYKIDIVNFLKQFNIGCADNDITNDATGWFLGNSYSSGGGNGSSIVRPTVYTDNDRYITGATYSNGTLYLTNNSGTTISVSGFTTGSTGSVGNTITAVTFSNNYLTLSDNTGGTLTTLIDYFTGLTVNGIIQVVNQDGAYNNIYTNAVGGIVVANSDGETNISINDFKILLGANAGANSTTNVINAFGYAAGQNNSGSSVTMIGNYAGQNNPYDNVILLGTNASASTANQFALSNDITSMKVGGFASGAGYVMTDVAGNGILSLQPAASGSTDTNFATTDLTATGNRTHDFNGFGLDIQSVSGFSLTNTLTSTGFTAYDGGTMDFTNDLIFNQQYANIPNQADNSPVDFSLDVNGVVGTYTFLYDIDNGNGTSGYYRDGALADVTTCLGFYSLITGTPVNVVIQVEKTNVTVDETMDLAYFDGNNLKKANWSGIDTLQSVTDRGNRTTNAIIVSGGSSGNQMYVEGYNDGNTIRSISSLNYNPSSYGLRPKMTLSLGTIDNVTTSSFVIDNGFDAYGTLFQRTTESGTTLGLLFLGHPTTNYLSNVPLGDGTLALSVNGVKADRSGNIVISTGGTGSGTYLTASTFSNNYLTLSNNTGGTLSTLIDNFTGLTVNGDISGSTHYLYDIANGAYGTLLLNDSGFEVKTINNEGIFRWEPNVLTIGTGSTLYFNVDLTTPRMYIFPDKSGVIALTGDLVTITASTFSNNYLNLINNTGGTISTLIDNFTGLTVNGNISATTYLNLPVDIRVTGGTYTAGTATFTNNTGGTFSVSGFSTGTTISFAPIDSVPNANGATISNNIITLQPASASFGGVITNDVQTFAGNKTFNGSTTLSAVTVAPYLTTSGFVFTGSSPSNMIDINGTWNSTGATSTVIRMNITNTASSAANQLVDFQVGGVTQFSITKTGSIFVLNNVLATYFYNNSTPANANFETFSTVAGITSAIGLNGSSSTVSRFRIGGATSSTIAANSSYSSLFLQSSPVTIAASGTHPVFSTLGIKAPTITTGAGTLSNAATLFVEGAPNFTGSTNYSIFVPSGANRFDGFVYAPKILGGTGSASTLTLQATSGTGTTGSDIIFLVGNNGATEAFKITNAGSLTSNAGSISIGGGFDANLVKSANYLRAGATSIIFWNGRSIMNSPIDGQITLSNAGATSFTRLNLGLNTSSAPAIAVSGTGINIVLADNSAFTGLQSLYHRFGSGSPEGVVTAPVGCLYSRTDGGAGSTLYVKESGTGNTGWIAK